MFDKYVIKNGENLDTIAKRFDCNTHFLKDINNIPFSDYVRAGMEIVVPKGGKEYFSTYKIESGDTLLQVARKYNINPELLATMNGLEMDDFIYPGQDILIPKSGYSYYVTKEGDTLATAATTFNSNIQSILDHNDVIYLLPGQLLVDKRSQK